MRLGAGDVALVTGGSSGLGAASVAALLDTGAAVVVLDQAAPDPRVAGRVHHAAADVRDEVQVQAAVDRAEDLGTLRVLVTCAGVATPGRLLGRHGVLDLDEFRRVLEINLVGTVNVLRLAAQVMAGHEPSDGDRGVVVMTASVAAFDGQVGQAAYAASKGGIAALTISAARDLAQHAIRVMTIAPGLMETPMLAGLPEATRTSLEALVPHPARLGRPAEYAQLVSAIIANPLLNGEVIRLDGGLRMPPR